MRVIIVSNGSISNYNFYSNIFNETDFIICADGGARHLANMNVVPDIIIGDLDSISSEDKRFYESQKVEFIRFPTKKNATDTDLAAELALTKNPREIIFLGAIGNRMDHTLANIFLLLSLMKKGIKGKLIDEKNEIYLIDDKLEIDGEREDFLSIIPVTKMVRGVSCYGLEYPLSNAEINLGSTLGISNKFSHNTAQIKVDQGLLLVIKSRD